MPDTAVPFFLLRTKLYRPALPDDHIIRHRLLSALESSAHQPLTLLVAPAGYGKTTLLNGWIEQTACPVAWLSLDEGDNQLAIFLEYFVAAIGTIFPDFGAQLQMVREASSLPPLPVINALLVNALDALPQDFVLVLDDYHLITTPEIHILLDNLLHQPPRPLHLILLSRQEPPLKIAQLRARHQIVEIRMKDLRFSQDEVARFTERNLPTVPDDATIVILTEKTEGWAVGLRLATIAIRQWGIADEQPTILQVDNQYVMDYLVNEVLAKQPTAVRDFLLITSLLERFCPPLCAALCAPLMDSDPAANLAILPQLVEEGLFIEVLDGQGQWYRYHQLFRQALRQRLTERYSTAEIVHLHRQASTWLAAHGFVEEGIDHALRGGGRETAVNILAEQGHTLMDEERWRLLDKYLHKFPPELRHENPKLLVLSGWLHLSRWRLDRVESVRQSMVNCLEQVDLTPDDRLFLQSSCHSFEAVRDTWGGNFQNGVISSRAALFLAPREWGLLRGYCWVYLGASVYFANGEQAALTVLTENDADYREETALVQARKKVAFVLIHWLSANPIMLMQECELGLNFFNSRQMASTTISFFHLFKGSVHYLRNELALAAEQFAVVLEMRYLFHPHMVVLSAIGLAMVHQAEGRGDKAWQVMETAVAFCLELEFPQLLFTVRAFQQELVWQQGHLAQTRHWVAVTDFSRLPQVIVFSYDPRLTLCKLLLAQDTPASRQRAEFELERLADLTLATYNVRFQMEVLALQALLYKAQGKTAAAHTAVQEAIRLAEPAEFIRLFVDLGPKMGELLAWAYGVGERPYFVQQVLDLFPTTVLPTAVQTAAIQQKLVEPLTDREMDVLHLLAQRLSNKEIAGELMIAPETVKRHTINIYQKLGVASRRQAVVQAHTLGLLPQIS